MDCVADRRGHGVTSESNRHRHVQRSYRVKTVSKLRALQLLGLALSEKQIPQIVENSKKCGELLEPLEGDGMRPRQVRYQAALRPDFLLI